MFSITKKTIPLLMTAMLLTACEDGSDNKTESHQKDNFDVNKTGRLSLIHI